MTYLAKNWTAHVSVSSTNGILFQLFELADISLIPKVLLLSSANTLQYPPPQSLTVFRLSHRLWFIKSIVTTPSYSCKSIMHLTCLLAIPQQLSVFSTSIKISLTTLENSTEPLAIHCLCKHPGRLFLSAMTIKTSLFPSLTQVITQCRWHFHDLGLLEALASEIYSDTTIHFWNMVATLPRWLQLWPQQAPMMWKHLCIHSCGSICRPAMGQELQRKVTVLTFCCTITTLTSTSKRVYI